MDFAYILQYAHVVFRELAVRKGLTVFVAALVAFAVLVVGYFWPPTYATSATIYADNQNILGPLLKNQAFKAKIDKQAQVVLDKLHSPTILSQVATDLSNKSSAEEALSMSKYISNVRSKVQVENLTAGYLKLSYSDSTPRAAFNTLSSVIDVFIRESAEEQKAESREAFRFIDSQVQQYKDQLVLAEDRLKVFDTQNFDGRLGDVQARINSLRNEIEGLKVNIDEDKSIIKSLQAQLELEDEFTNRKPRDLFSERLVRMQADLENMLLNYTEDYPDVVSMRFQIEDMKRRIAESENQPQVSNDPDDIIPNPLYMELRSRLSQAETDLKSKEKRLVVIGGLMDQEFERRERVAARGAEKSELTRDYNVTRKIYEDMLERKEKARLSMTLNIEGQGVTYRIQEPPALPKAPTGIRYVHFAIAGPIVGLFFMIGLFVVFVQLDPRIRLKDDFSSIDVPLLGVIPHMTTASEQKSARNSVVLTAFFGISLLATYIYVAVFLASGV